MQLLYVRLATVHGRAGYLDRLVAHGAQFLVEPGAAVVPDDHLGEDGASGEAPQLGAVASKPANAAVLRGGDHPDHLPLHATQARRPLAEELVEVKPPEPQLRPPSVGAHHVVRFTELPALFGDQLRDARVDVLLIGDGEPADPLFGRSVRRLWALDIGLPSVHRSSPSP